MPEKGICPRSFISTSVTHECLSIVFQSMSLHVLLVLRACNTPSNAADHSAAVLWTCVDAEE